MTSSAPPPSSDRRFARDVAQQLDRKRVRRKLGLWSVLLAIVAAAAMYLRCGAGFGLGGGGKGPGEGGESTQTQRAATGPVRCALRLSGTGITVDGKPMSRDDAAAACKAIGGADLIVTGDAREGDRPALLRALGAAGITDIVVQEPTAGSSSR
jgi:hypothetical protein